MEGELFKQELEKFARWFEKKDHGTDNYLKIVERYVKEKGDEIHEDIHFHWPNESLCECKKELDRPD